MMVGRLVTNSGYLASVLVVAHAVGPAGRGAFAFVTTVILVLAVVLGGGMREGFVVFIAQRASERPQHATNLILAGVTSGLLGAALVLLTLGLVPEIRPTGVDAASVAIMACGVFLLCLSSGGNALNLGLQQFRLIALVQSLFVWLYSAALACVWLIWGMSVHTAAAMWVALQLSESLPLWARGLRRTRLGRPNVALLRETWRYGIRAWVGSFSTYLGFRSDQILMAFLSTEAQLGIYAVAVNVSEVSLYLPQSVGNALLPIAASAPLAERGARTMRVYRLVTLVTTAVVLLGAVSGPFILPAMFGHPFAGSVDPFLLLLPGAIPYVASSIFSTSLAASSAPGLSSVGPFATLLVNGVLDLVLIPPYGASGAAVASTCGFFFGGVAAFIAFRRVEPAQLKELIPRRTDALIIRDFIRRR